MGWPTLADLSHLPLPGTDAPGDVRFTPDGSALTYLQGDAGSVVCSLWRHDLESGRRIRLSEPDQEAGVEEALSLDERLQRERRRTATLGITEYAWLVHAEQPTLLVPVAGRAYVAIGEETLRGLRAVPGIDGASYVIGSPIGEWAAFVRDGDLWVAPLGPGAPRRLTSDAGDGVSNGLAEYAAAEELGRFEGLWWSRDGRSIAFAHVDEQHVPRFSIGHLADAAPSAEEPRYPFAGGPNARVGMRIVDLDGGPPRDVALPMSDDDYLARVVPHPADGWLVATLRRDQRELRWIRVLADTSAHELWRETGDPWLNLDDHTRVLEDGRILRTTERTGYRHLELRDPDGGWLAQLTAGDWAVTDVVHVDEPAATVFFMATRHGATERHLYRVGLTAPDPEDDPERLTAEPGWHSAVFSPDGGRWADTWSDPDTAPRLVVHGRAPEGPARAVAPPSCTSASLEVRPPELLQLVGADGATALHAALYRPAEPAADPPPCVVWVYGGPHAQYVKRAWEVTVHPLRQYLARAGVAVLVVDNRGSAFRGLAFEAGLHRNLGQLEVQDQAAAVRQLAERGEVDPGRVGITGGSYGGFMTLRAMALEPELFRIGVAVAPVVDWRGYDTAYTERYLGLPDDDAEAYTASSALELASRIRGDLLIIHGAIDENVHLRHSVRLVDALQAAGRDVELVLLPADRHRTRTTNGLRVRDRRTVTHLLDGLGVPMPPD